MFQSTLDLFLKGRAKRRSEDEDDAEQDAEEIYQRKESHRHATTRTLEDGPIPSHGVLRNLCWRSAGLQPVKRARKQLEAFEWSRLRQVAGYSCVGQLAESTGNNSVVSMSLSDSSVAFIQASGILNIYRLDLLQQDARKLRSRAENRRRQQQSDTAHDQSDSSDTEPDTQDPDAQQAGPGSGTGGEQSTTSRTAAHTLRHHARRLAGAAERAGAAVDALPAGGVRLDMGLKLEDVAWDPKHAGRMAVVGSGSHNVVVVDIGQGTRRKSLLTCKGVGGGQPSGPGFSSLKYLAQGPYSLAAASPHGARVCLWDTRRGAQSVAEVGTPGRAALQGPVEASPDGLLLYGLVQGNQLLVWDVRKGSQGTGVLQFGATGPYHHALLSHIDLSAALAAAAAAQHGDAGGEGGSGGAGASGLRWASACAAGGSGAGWAGVPGVCGLGPVDQVLVDPGDPARLGLVMQTCGAAVLSLAGAPQVTHLTLPPHAFYPGMSLVAPHRYTDLALKRGAWSPGGGALWVPHLWLDHAAQDYTAAMAPMPAPGAPPNAERRAAAAMPAHPTLAVLDCRAGRAGGGGVVLDHWGPLSSVGGGAGLGPRGTGHQQQPAAAALAPLSIHAVNGRVPAAVERALEEFARTRDVAAEASEESEAAALAALAVAREAVPAVREAAYRPPALVPVSDWVVCVAVHASGGGVLAGTHGGMVLWVGQD